MPTGIPLEPEKSSGDLNIHSSGVALVWICVLKIELLQVGNGLKGKAGEEASCSNPAHRAQHCSRRQCLHSHIHLVQSAAENLEKQACCLLSKDSTVSVK